tara:strand:- start:35 stop:349 length:315 start_codon:yes stop_codon:yes gene_type:complete
MSFKTSCGTCGEVIMLLKDSTEGQKVFHGGECYRKFQEEKDMKYKEVSKKILPRVEQLPARNEFECENKCGYTIQKSGNYWRVTDEKGANPMCVCFKCKEAKGM